MQTELKIYEILPCGAENAIPLRDLAALTGADTRTVRAAIARERKSGALILSSCRSDCGGYYRPADAEEIRAFRSHEIKAAIEGCAEALGKGGDYGKNKTFKA